MNTCSFMATTRQTQGSSKSLIHYVCGRPAKYKTHDGRYCCDIHKPEADRIAILKKQPTAVQVDF